MAEKLVPDPIYGQIHPKETPEVIEEKLKELDDVVEKLLPKTKKGWEQAKQNCPEQLNDAFKLMFLRCEVFNTKLAAQRMMFYWDRRIESFGPEKAFLPMTINGALRDDYEALKLGSFKILPSRGAMGRRIAVNDTALQFQGAQEKGISRESMHRITWYISHAALEDDETTQRHGVIYLVEGKGTNVFKVDNKLSKMNQRAAKGAIPIRMSCFHLVHPPAVLSVVWPLLKKIMSKRLLNRIRLHYGSNERILDELAKCEIPADAIPVENGGTLEFDFVGWLEKRKEEGK